MRLIAALLALPVALPLALSGATPAVADTAPVVTIATVGDIACDPAEPAFNDGHGTPAGCQQQAVGDAIRGINPQAFLALGDLQYFNGSYDRFMASYDPALGSLKPITYPIPGNHEYKTAGAAGYYEYFGAAAHQESKGSYSVNLGAWHIIGINSTACTASNSCGPGSAMAKWIAADVAANPSQCLMAMWHHPVWSAGANGNYAPMLAVWNQLNSYGADVVLNGHDHLYQRSKPIGQGSLAADGSVADPVVTEPGAGMVEFIVGTGGENNFEAKNMGNPAINAAMAAVDTNPNPAVFGALKMDLAADAYNYQFVPAAGSKVFSEAGSATCRTKTPPLGAPGMPKDITVTRAGDGTVAIAWNGGDANQGVVNYTANVVGSARKCESTSKSCTLTGLTNGKSYQVTVTASNTAGRLVSAPSASFVPAVRPSRPGVPTASVTGAQVTVSWPATSYNGGLPVTYVVRSTTGSYTCVTAELQCTIPVDPGTYRFTVLARNEVGDSALQTTANAISVAAPQAPSVAAVTRAGDGMAKVSVTPAADSATQPVVDYLIKAAPSAKTCVATLPATSCTVSGLTNGTSYTFTAAARTAKASSAPSIASPALVVGRVPARLTPPTVTAAGPGAVTLNWSPTTYEGGLPVSGYEVLVGNGPTVVCQSAALSCTATGLTKGTSYWFTVVAINDAGRSANSAGSAVVKVS